MGWPDEPFLNLRQTTTPKGSAPNGGQLVYVKSDGKLYTKIAGVETVLAGDVTLNGVQTLTNKTLTTPIIDSILGSNGLTVASFASVANAVNSLQIFNNIATGAVRLVAQGTDTNISINVVPKGTGTLKQNGVDVATVSDTQTLTNKTITSATFLAGTLTQLPLIKCTSATRPAHNAGQTIWETDTSKVQISNGTAWVLIGEDTGWQTPTLTNSWTNLAGFQSARYRRVDGIVYIEGHIVPGTNAAAAFTLPAGYRPAASLIMQGNTNSTALTVGRFDIATTGTVTPQGGAVTWLSINCSFPADA